MVRKKLCFICKTEELRRDLDFYYKNYSIHYWFKNKEFIWNNAPIFCEKCYILIKTIQKDTTKVIEHKEYLEVKAKKRKNYSYDCYVISEEIIQNLKKLQVI
jgi:hypothetical protein